MAIKVEINPSYEWGKGTKKLGISHRELEVLVLLAKGFDNEAIADILRIQYQSVKNHMYHLNKKLRTSNSAQVLAIAVGKGLIKIENTELAGTMKYTTVEKFWRFLSKAAEGEDTQLTKKIKKWLIRHGIDVDI